jgi:hypothetical protein
MKYLGAEIFHGFHGGVEGALSNDYANEMEAMKL